MKIEKAIEILERRLASPFVKANQDTMDATRLGIEALEQIKAARKYAIGPTVPGRLPGETEE